MKGDEDNKLSVIDKIQKVKGYFLKVDKEFHPEKYEHKKKEEKAAHHIYYDKPINRIVQQTVASNIIKMK